MRIIGSEDSLLLEVGIASALANDGRRDHATCLSHHPSVLCTPPQVCRILPSVHLWCVADRFSGQIRSRFDRIESGLGASL